MKKTKDLKKETKEIVMKDELENVRYDEELFVVVDSENKENIISEFCRNLFRYNLSDSEREMDNSIVVQLSRQKSKTFIMN